MHVCLCGTAYCCCGANTYLNDLLKRAQKGLSMQIVIKYRFAVSSTVDNSVKFAILQVPVCMYKLFVWVAMQWNYK